MKTTKCLGLIHVRLLAAVAMSSPALSGCAGSKGQVANDLFAQFEFELGTNDVQTVLPGFFRGGATADIAVFGIDETRQRRVWLFGQVGEAWIPILDAPLHPGVQFVDVIRIGEQDRLLTYRHGLAHWFDPDSKTEHLVASMNTAHAASEPAAISHVDVTRDLNRDGLDDMIFPDIDGFWISTQLTDGTFADPVKLGPTEPFLDETMPDRDQTYREVGLTAESVPWYLSRLHEVDLDRDGSNDLVFWNKDHFVVYRQDEESRFGSVPTTFDVNVQFDSDGAYTRMFDYADVDVLGSFLGGGDLTSRTVLHSIRDLNGDDVVDLATMTLSGRSMLKQRSEINIHFGSVASDGIVFAKESDATLRPAGTAWGMQPWGYASQVFDDLDNNGTQEVVIKQVSTGLDGMFRAMIGKSVALGLEFFSIQNKSYPRDASATRRICPKVNPFLQGVYFPAVLLGDVTGDGLTDLIVGRDSNELYVFPGVPDAEFFATDPLRVAVDLPNDEQKVMLADLNQDRKQDLIVYHAERGDPHRMIVLVAN